jgi:hypothetical protein
VKVLMSIRLLPCTKVGIILLAPYGINLREAKVGHFNVGPLHKSLKKGVSEPCWVG